MLASVEQFLEVYFDPIRSQLIRPLQLFQSGFGYSGALSTIGAQGLSFGYQYRRILAIRHD